LIRAFWKTGEADLAPHTRHRVAISDGSFQFNSNMTAVTVTVQNMAGDLFYVEMLGTQRVGELKRRLQQQQPHMAASRQQLILMPRDGEEDATRMADSKLLNSYCITSDMTVYLILTDFQDFSAVRFC
jgi:hypothetical protein